MPGAPDDEAATQDAVELSIARLGARGDGVVDMADGAVAYVPFALPGERVRASVDAKGRGQAVEILEASPDRIAPACAHFGVCGGCVAQHMEVGLYRDWKRALVREALKRAGLDAPVGRVVDAGGTGRRRATFHAVRAKSVGFAFGFSQAASHHVFALDACPVLSPALAAALPRLRQLAEVLLPKAGRADIQATETESGLDVDVRGGAAKADRVSLTSDLAVLAEAADWARVTLAGDTLLQRRAPVVRLGGVSVAPPPGAFLQATREGEDVLTRRVMDIAADATKAVDLYAGLGTFALQLARQAETRAFEGAAASVAALKRAADAAPAAGMGLKPLLAQRRDLTRSPVTGRELGRPDIIVLDPPRAGAGPQAAEIVKSGAACVAYVSCNPASFARDALTLVDGGFRLESVLPVDQFKWSAHLELVGEFRR